MGTTGTRLAGSLVVLALSAGPAALHHLTATAAPATTTVTGTVVHVEPTHAHSGAHAHPHGTAGAAADDGHGAGRAETLLQVGNELVPLGPSAVDRVRAGAKVTVVLGAAGASRPHRPVEEVLASPGPEDPDDVAAVDGAGPVHRVYLALVAPAGTVPDTAVTLAAARTAVEQAGDFWRDQTRGAVDLQVTGTADWSTTTATCADYWGLWNHAAGRVAFPKAAGDHLVVVVPRSATSKGCALGLGTVGGSASSGGYSYAAGTGVSVVAHELGHNLSLGHSGSLYCPAASDSSDALLTGCSKEEYGDLFDVMGYGGDFSPQGNLGVRHREVMGLVPAMRTVSGDGADTTVDLVPLSQHSDTSTHAVKVLDPAGTTYWLEYRQPVGLDARTTGAQHGVRISRLDPGKTRNVLLVDPTPTRYADRQQALPVGAAWFTASRRTRVTLVEQDAARARLRIETSATPYPVTPGTPPVTPPTEGPASSGTLLALASSARTAYLGAYTVSGVVYDADRTVVKGAPVQLQAQQADGSWLTLKTTKTGAAGTASFSLKAAATRIPVRLMTVPAGTSSVDAVSAPLSMRVFTPVVVGRVAGPPRAGTATTVTGTTKLLSAATLRVEHRALDAKGVPLTTAWTVGSSAVQVTDADKGAFALPLTLPTAGLHEVRLVRLATPQQEQTVSKSLRVAVKP